MGATNPVEAADGTLRKEFGSSVGENATHGSDAPETAAFEDRLFLFRIGAAVNHPNGYPCLAEPRVPVCRDQYRFSTSQSSRPSFNRTCTFSDIFTCAASVITVSFPPLVSFGDNCIAT